jgi:hypothetical protein
MTATDAAIQIRSLRAQLDVLEARLRNSSEPEHKEGHTLADLHGILQEESQSTAEEIDQVKYRGIAEDIA